MSKISRYDNGKYCLMSISELEQEIEMLKNFAKDLYNAADDTDHPIIKDLQKAVAIAILNQNWR